MRLTAIAAAVALASGLAPADAAVITDTQGYFFNTSAGDPHSDHFPLTFDPTLGKLDGVSITVSAPSSYGPGTGYNGNAFVTVTPGHTSILTLRAAISVNLYNEVDNSGYSKSFNLPTVYWVIGPPSNFAEIGATYPNFYATFTVSPALFADGAIVDTSLWASETHDPFFQCVAQPYCHWHWGGGDGGFSSGGNVITTYLYTPTPAKVPEPPSLLLLAGAVVALGATRLTRS